MTQRESQVRPMTWLPRREGNRGRLQQRLWSACETLLGQPLYLHYSSWWFWAHQCKSLKSTFVSSFFFFQLHQIWAICTICCNSFINIILDDIYFEFLCFCFSRPVKFLASNSLNFLTFWVSNHLTFLEQLFLFFREHRTYI